MYFSLHDLTRLYESNREPGQLPYMLFYRSLFSLYSYILFDFSQSRAVCFVTNCVFLTRLSLYTLVVVYTRA